MRRQSEHFADYAAALKTLDERGLLYPCFCTRKEIAEEIARAAEAPHGPDGPLYPGTCRRLSHEVREARMAAGESYALRLDVEKAVTAIARPLTFVEQGAGPAGETGEQIVRPALFGDVVLARKELARELSPRRRGRRCASGRDAGDARPRPVSRDPYPAPAPGMSRI